MLFDILNDIQTTKKCNLNTDEYSPYMIARWMSFYSDDVAKTINETINRYGALLEREEHYKAMAMLTPKTKYSKKISYIKKAQVKAQKDDLHIVAKNLQMSKKELQQILDFQQSLQ